MSSEERTTETKKLNVAPIAPVQTASAVEHPKPKLEVAPTMPPPVQKPATVPVPVVVVVPAAPRAPEAPPVSVVVVGDPVDQARSLWRKAIDAEANQDFALAVKCYEQIKKLPDDVQPAGLEVRLEQARKQTK